MGGSRRSVWRVKPALLPHESSGGWSGLRAALSSRQPLSSSHSLSKRTFSCETKAVVPIVWLAWGNVDQCLLTQIGAHGGRKKPFLPEIPGVTYWSIGDSRAVVTLKSPLRISDNSRTKAASWRASCPICRLLNQSESSLSPAIVATYSLRCISISISINIGISICVYVSGQLAGAGFLFPIWALGIG